MKDRDILKSAYLAAMLSILGLVPALSLAAQVAIPGTSVSMEAPPGFTVSRSFSGLENAARDSNILVAEFPAEMQEEVAKLFADPGAAKSYFERQGVAINGKSILTLDGKSVPFLTGSQSNGKVKYDKYIALIQGDMTVMIQFTIRDPRSLTQGVAKETIASVKLLSSLTLQQKADQLPFSFTAVAPFKLYAVTAGITVGLATFEGTDATGLLPIAGITRVGGASKSMTPVQMAQSLVRYQKGFETAAIKSVKEVVFADGPATYLEAVSPDLMLVQYLRVQNDGILICLTARGARAEMDKVMGAVAEMAGSVSVRK